MKKMPTFTESLQLFEEVTSKMKNAETLIADLTDEEYKLITEIRDNLNSLIENYIFFCGEDKSKLKCANKEFQVLINGIPKIKGFVIDEEE